MADDNDEGMVDKLILIGTSALAAWLAQKLLGAVWKKATGHDAPKDPLDNESNIAGIVTFAGVTGAVAALSRIAANKGARKVTSRISAGRTLKASR
ncbi:uncharacterized protein DUF4235 [Flavimobilis soli]|uniref:Uncharacterized protein DUF4235 n=1 Tax=Flavimobilis soli TaxID=442709 RepID=A0A2A9EDP6_9MICO|nr:DUF4235 domain-containing protein [Flavimobilis soli]PFG36681.1 uncharacterized protein DUF4235 [Flavimobilis soli]